MKIGYALGGGGARGAAHIGALLELEHIGLQPDLVVGTSIGGLVGALLAAGLPAAEMLNFFQEMSLDNIYRPAPIRAAALASSRPLETLLETAIGRPTFAELQRPLAIVATDLVNRQEVILQTGDVITAVLATTAIPLALPPVKTGDRVLVDGGIKNNLPFNVARQLGADYVLAIDLMNTTPFAPEVRSGSTGPITKAFDLMQRQEFWAILSATIDVITSDNTARYLAESPPDLLLRPEIGAIGLFDFHRWQEGVSAGRTAVWEVEHVLEKLISSES